VAAHAPVHAHELCAGPAKIEAGVKILAEEVERPGANRQRKRRQNPNDLLWLPTARQRPLRRTPHPGTPSHHRYIASAIRCDARAILSSSTVPCSAAPASGRPPRRPGLPRWLHKSHFSACASRSSSRSSRRTGRPPCSFCSRCSGADRRARPHFPLNSPLRADAGAGRIFTLPAKRRR
jgi:hypothetical protein